MIRTIKFHLIVLMNWINVKNFELGIDAQAPVGKPEDYIF